MMILNVHLFLTIWCFFTWLCHAHGPSSELATHKNLNPRSSSTSPLFEDNIDHKRRIEASRSSILQKRVIINQGITRSFFPGVFDGIQFYWVARLQLVYNLIPTQAAAQGLEAFYDAAIEVCRSQGQEPVRRFTIAIGAFTLDLYSRPTTGIPWLAVVAFLEEMRRSAGAGLDFTFSGELEPVMAGSLTGAIFGVRLRIMGLP